MGRRFLAWVIDTFVLVALAIALGVALSPTAGVVFFIVSPLYFIAFEASPWEGTPAKRLLGLSVVDTTGCRLTLWRAVGRTAARIVAVAPAMLGYAVALLSPERQAVHDLMAGTLVIRRSQRQQLQPPARSIR